MPHFTEIGFSNRAYLVQERSPMKLPATLSTVSLTTLMKELAGRGKRLPTSASNAIYSTPRGSPSPLSTEAYDSVPTSRHAARAKSGATSTPPAFCGVSCIDPKSRPNIDAICSAGLWSGVQSGLPFKRGPYLRAESDPELPESHLSRRTSVVSAAELFASSGEPSVCSGSVIAGSETGCAGRFRGAAAGVAPSQASQASGCRCGVWTVTSSAGLTARLVTWLITPSSGSGPCRSSGPKTEEITDAVSDSNGESMDLRRPNMPSRRSRALPSVPVPPPSDAQAAGAKPRPRPPSHFAAGPGAAGHTATRLR
jgi:hypothetical protein